ncbi:MAG: rod shape-determining protein [Deltaproteobacteria bacterium]|nr:rod shape-determining protein [Deltaproteobacteria bacterium]MDZ4344149.1 rod shape-determining protein [Candidatus Binatia bacterium]
MEESNETLSVGIDLGTSRSSISASNGERHVIDSYVGWPVDLVARKLVKKSVLVGRDALDNRSMLELRRPLERGVIKEGSEKDEEAVQELLRHLISLIGIKQKGKNRPKVRAVVGVPAEAFRVSKQRLRRAMDGIADSVMLVSEPFAVAYGLEALLHTLIIDIGAGTADFCVMQGRYPTEQDQRTLPDAGDGIDEQLAKLLREHHPDAQFSIHMLREWKEKWSFVGEPSARVLVTVPAKGKATELDITNEMRAACESILPPVCETMIDLLTRVEPEFQEKVRNNVIISGGSSLIAGLPDALEKALLELGGGHVTVVKDPIFAGSDGGLAIARDATSSDWEKLSL